MTRLKILMVVLLVASGCGGGSETATPAITAPPTTTEAAPTTTAAPPTTAAPTTTAVPEESSDAEKRYEAFLAMRARVMGGDFVPLHCTATIVGTARSWEYATQDPSDDELLLLEPCFAEIEAVPTTTLDLPTPNFDVPENFDSFNTVSYTHLTLPTSDLV